VKPKRRPRAERDETLRPVAPPGSNATVEARLRAVEESLHLTQGSSSSTQVTEVLSLEQSLGRMLYRPPPRFPGRTPAPASAKHLRSRGRSMSTPFDFSPEDLQHIAGLMSTLDGCEYIRGQTLRARHHDGPFG
jgi:hypothetical protein